MQRKRVKRLKYFLIRQLATDADADADADAVVDAVVDAVADAVHWQQGRGGTKAGSVDSAEYWLLFAQVYMKCQTATTTKATTTATAT